MKLSSAAPLVGMLVLGLAVMCTGRTLHAAEFFFPHVTVTHTTSAPDNGDQPYTAFDDLIGPGYTGYLSSSDRLKVFQELIQPNLEKDGFRVCTIENVESDCEQCSDECTHQFQILHASICKGRKQVCTTSKCTQSKQVCRAPGDISGGIKSAGVPIKVWFHVPVDGSNTPHWGVTKGRLQQTLDEANSLVGQAGFKLVLAGVNYFRASKEDMTARGGDVHSFNTRQAQIMGDQRKGGLDTLNVWLADQSGQEWGALGIFPHYTTMGKNNACNEGIYLMTTDTFGGGPPGRIAGAVLAHELGHWLQLPHTFREDATSKAFAQRLNNRANIPEAKQDLPKLCAVDNDSDKLREWLPQMLTGRVGFDPDTPLSTPHQPLMHLDPAVLALAGWDGFKDASSGNSAAMANYKALGCGGVGSSKVVKSCPNTQDRPDDYTNMMDYQPDACRTVYTAQQIAVMHTAWKIRQEISINGKTGKYPNMQASRCLTGA